MDSEFLDIELGMHIPTAFGDGRKAKILCKYDAVRSDELSVLCGEQIRVLEWKEGRCFAVKSCNEGKRCVSGWLPDYIVEQAQIQRTRSESRPRSSSPIRPSPFVAPRLHKISSLIAHSLRSSSPGQHVARQASSRVIRKKPFFVSPLRDAQVGEHSRVDLVCQASGPDADGGLAFVWSGPAVQEGQNRVVQKTCGNGIATLTILDVHISDGGQYCCTAVNNFGRCVTSMLLVVIVAPSEPGQPTVPELCGTSIRLNWTPPTSTGGSPTMWYSVLYRTEDAENFEVAIECTRSNDIIIDDLHPGRTYWFRVRAYNEAFVGPASPPSKPVVIPGPSEEDEPGVDSVRSSRAASSCDAASSIRGDIQPSLTPEWRKDFDDKFKIFSDAGFGRFAVVKQAYSRTSSAPVAVKMFQRKETSRETVQREWSILAQLAHKHIIPAGVLFENERYFMIAMQWVPGPQLFDFVCQSGQYDERVAQTFMRQLFNALAYLHSRQFGHLDIKPENLLVDPKSEPSLYLIDFGDAICFKSNLDIRSPYYQGNVEYASAEQVDSKSLSCSADLWSAGVLLYVFLSGLSPFLDETVEETCRNILAVNYILPIERFSPVSASARNLIQSLLVLEPRERMSAEQCLKHNWFEQDLSNCAELSLDRLAQYVARRRYQVTTRSYILPL